jgi:aminoglycoside phosphotransferase (APT) family kinase protein
VSIDAAAVVAALRLPPETTVEVEPLGERPAAPVCLALCPPGQRERVVLVRRDPDPERAANHLAVLEALTNRGFPFAPRLLGIAGEAAIEEYDDGLTALNVEVVPEALADAVDALAALHALELREGLRWELSPEALLGEEEFPLHRLGFAAHERAPAHAALLDARSALLAGPFGFVHGHATAANVRFTRQGPRLGDFSAAGFGHQLFDVAAFLATCGAGAGQRQELAGRYAHARQLDLSATTNAIELATIWWGLHELLGLPRRLVETLGDDAEIEALKLAAARIERAMREPAGASAVAVAIRAALWPA